MDFKLLTDYKGVVVTLLGGNMSSTSEVGFLKALFDFQLRHFITLRVLRVLYAITAVIILITGVVIILYTLTTQFSYEPMVAILTILATILGVLLYLILVRLWIETLANLQRIGDNTQKMADQSHSA